MHELHIIHFPPIFLAIVAYKLVAVFLAGICLAVCRAGDWSFSTYKRNGAAAIRKLENVCRRTIANAYFLLTFNDRYLSTTDEYGTNGLGLVVIMQCDLW